MNIKLNKLFFIFSLFSIHLIPFAYNISFETFPILLIFFCIFIFLMLDNNILNYVNNSNAIFLLIIFLILYFIKDFFSHQTAEIIHLIKYLIGPIIFLFYKNLKKFFGIDEMIMFGIVIFSIYMIFKFQFPILFNLTCQILEFLIGRVDCSSLFKFHRPFLITPEPSYLSLMLSYYLLVLFRLKEEIDNSKKKIFVSIIEIFICYILIETSSRIGFFFTCIYGFIYVIKNKKNLFLVFLFLSLSYLTISTTSPNFTLLNKQNSIEGDIINESLINSRSILGMDRMFKTFSNKNNLNELKLSNKNENEFLMVFNRMEPTGFVRIFHNYISLFQSINNKFTGYGIGSYPILWHEHSIYLGIDNFIKKNEVMNEWEGDLSKKNQNIQNYFFAILHDAGIIPALIIFFVICSSVKKLIINKNRFGFVILFYVLATFLLQSTITSPYPWLALAMIFFDNKKYA